MSAPATDGDDGPEIILQGDEGVHLTQQLENAARFVLSHIQSQMVGDRLVTPHPAAKFLVFRSWPSERVMFRTHVAQDGSTTIAFNGVFLVPFIFPGYRVVSMRTTEDGNHSDVKPSAEKITPTQQLQCLLIDFMFRLHEDISLQVITEDEFYETYLTLDVNLFRIHTFGAHLRDDGLPFVRAVVTKPILSAQDLLISPPPPSTVTAPVTTVQTTPAATTVIPAAVPVAVPAAVPVAVPAAVPAAVLAAVPAAVRPTAVIAAAVGATSIATSTAAAVAHTRAPTMPVMAAQSLAAGASQIPTPATVLASIEATKKRKIDEVLVAH